MRVHHGEKFPCSKCGKVLATRQMWTEHTKACVQGNWVACPDCGQEYASTLGTCQHHKAKHGAEAPTQVQGGFVCPFCGKGYQIKKTCVEHKPYCPNSPNHKGPFYCRVAGCPSTDHPFTHMRNLNLHMSNLHGWKEWWMWGLGSHLNECPSMVNDLMNDWQWLTEWVMAWGSMSGWMSDHGHGGVDRPGYFSGQESVLYGIVGWWGTRPEWVLNKWLAWCPKAIVACLICSVLTAAMFYFIYWWPMCFIFSFSLLCPFW